MTENLNLSEFSTEGFNIGKDAKVLAKLYGISDFWSYIFEDASKVNLALEAGALTASDIYNKFLQLSSVISLEDIQTLTGAQIKLVILSSANQVKDKVETYYLPTEYSVLGAKCVANRAFLPTVKLEDNLDYFIDTNEGSIAFSRPLGEIGFPFRYNSTTGGKEYALWFIDAKIDDGLIYSHYAKLIGVDPAKSSDDYKNFVYGLYYLYVNGPNLATLRKGLNITLGIPLARDNSETVLEIRKYLNTDQYLVITDLNSYVIPYGLSPKVVEGDVLNTGDEIALWVEVKDYINDGDWWINFMIPHSILPNVPTDIPGRNRYATEGSYADYLMRNYLKKHTFLVNVKTVSFKNIQTFEQLSSIISEVKPSYTAPIYVWTVPIPDEILEISDEELKLTKCISRCESLTDGTIRHVRDSSNPLLRDCPHTTRMSVNMNLDQLTGFSNEINGHRRSYVDGYVSGFVAPQRGYRALTDHESAWLTTLRTRNQDQMALQRGKLDRFRSNVLSGPGLGVNPYTSSEFIGYRMVFLHCSTEADVKKKFDFAGVSMPTDKYVFTLFKPQDNFEGINEHVLNGSIDYNYYDTLVENFDFLFNRGADVHYISPFLAKDSYKTFTPTRLDVFENDFLAFTRIWEEAIGVFWITQNFNIQTPPYWSREPSDSLKIKLSGKITRGMAPLGSPYFQVRGCDPTLSYQASNAIDEKQINDNQDTTVTVQVYYSDDYNISFPVDRSGRNLITSTTVG